MVKGRKDCKPGFKMRVYLYVGERIRFTVRERTRSCQRGSVQFGVS